MRESLEVTLQSFGNDDWGVIITFCMFDGPQSSLPFVCSTVSSVSYNHIRGSVRLASDSDLTDEVYL